MDKMTGQRKILEQIRDTIKGLVAGEISYSEASDSYRTLKDHTLTLKDSLHGKKTGDIIPGLMHNHNTSNFCKYTGEIVFEKDTLSEINHSGNSLLVESLMEPLLSHKSRILNTEHHSFSPEQPGELTYRVFTARSAAPGGERVYLAITSSHYTKEDKFRKFTETSNACYHIMNAPRGKFAENFFFRQTRHEMEEFLTRYTEAGVSVKCMLYRFDNIYQIFQHCGLKTLFDIDARIQSSLQSYHGYSACVTIVGPSLYMVLLPVEEEVASPPDSAPARLLFEYDQVLFRYWVFRKLISKKEEVEGLVYWMSEIMREKI